MIQEILDNPRPLSEDEIEEMADNIVQGFCTSGLSYYAAHKILEAHKEVFERAFTKLGHNALYEFGKQPMNYML